MTGTDDSYIAWDGSRYQGSPPSGWYLAADNRWWPSQDLIDSGRRATGDGPGVPSTATSDTGASVAGTTPVGSDATARTPPPPTMTPPASARQRPSTQQVPAPDWAPQHGSYQSPSLPYRPPAPNGQLPPRPQTPPPPGRTPVPGVPAPGPSTTGEAPPLQRRRRRRGKAGPGFLIPILVFLLFRCGVAADTSADPGLPPLPTLAPTTTTVFDSPAVTVGPPVIDVEGLEIRPTGCGPGTFTAGATNTGPTVTGFDVVIEIVEESASGPVKGMTVERTIGPLEPGQSEPLIVPLEDPIADAQACKLLRVSPNN